MKSLRRLLFLIRQIIYDLWVCAGSNFNAQSKARRQSEKQMREECLEADFFGGIEADLPPIDPVKSMAFHSWTKNNRCNVFTVQKYKKQIVAAIAWGISIGIDTYYVDYTTPYGLLALETLLEERKVREQYQIRIYQSEHFHERRSYRLIKETPVELYVLASNADYYCGADPMIAFVSVLPCIAIHHSESGYLIIDKKLPPGYQKPAPPD